MWKQRLKHNATTLANQLGLWSLFDSSRNAWTIVCYHRVLPAPARADYFCPDLVVTPETLRAHCAHYREHYEVLTVRDAHARLQSGTPQTKPLLSLSFDDGYRDNFVHAAPILDEFDLKASFYIIAGLIDTDELPWYDKVTLAIKSSPENPSQGEPAPTAGRSPRAVVEEMKGLKNVDRLALLARLRQSAGNPELDLIMTTDQLQTLHRRGHEIGAHSLTHPILTQVAPSDLAPELAGARERLERAVKAPITTFCYPNGDFNANVLAGIRDAGYTAALSTAQGRNTSKSNRYALHRVFINEDWLRAPGGKPSQALLRAELALLHRFRA